MRLIIGSEYLRAGDRARAGTVFREHAAEYPPYRYELGLLHLQKQKWAEAATSLRYGFVDNPYIVEILCGNPDPMPLPIWEGSNWQEAETAREYVGEYGELWRRTADAREFLRWLHTHPRVMAERAAVIECRQELLWENDFNARGRILDRERAVCSGMESTLSGEIIKPRTDRRGQPMAPWKDPRGAGMAVRALRRLLPWSARHIAAPECRRIRLDPGSCDCCGGAAADRPADLAAGTTWSRGQEAAGSSTILVFCRSGLPNQRVLIVPPPDARGVASRRRQGRLARRRRFAACFLRAGSRRRTMRADRQEEGARCRRAESWTRCAARSTRSRANSSPYSALSRRSRGTCRRPSGAARRRRPRWSAGGNAR